MQTLNVKAVAFAAGITWAIYVAFCGWAAALGWGGSIVNALETYYVGYAPTPLGGVIGGVWAIFDGAIAGAIFSLLYNRFARR